MTGHRQFGPKNAPGLTFGDEEIASVLSAESDIGCVKAVRRFHAEDRLTGPIENPDGTDPDMGNDEPAIGRQCQTIRTSPAGSSHRQR